MEAKTQSTFLKLQSDTSSLMFFQNIHFMVRANFRMNKKPTFKQTESQQVVKQDIKEELKQKPKQTTYVTFSVRKDYCNMSINKNKCEKNLIRSQIKENFFKYIHCKMLDVLQAEVVTYDQSFITLVRKLTRINFSILLEMTLREALVLYEDYILSLRSIHDFSWKKSEAVMGLLSVGMRDVYFEFIESGIFKSIASEFSNGLLSSYDKFIECAHEMRN